jgi:2-dehydropantoate 2-reductase
MKIGIIGAGAVGSILARELNKLPENEFQLTVMARTARNGFTVLEDGIKIFHDIPVHDILSVKDTCPVNAERDN